MTSNARDVKKRPRSESTMPEEAEAKQKSKHRRATCSGCRRRKSKCDGKTPKCTTCIAYKDECHYDKPPSLAYVRSLEEEISELKAQLRQSKSQAWVTKTNSLDDTKLHPDSPVGSASDSRLSDNNLLSQRSARHVKWEVDISVDDEGGVAYHNSTSAVHDPPSSSSSQMPLTQVESMTLSPLEDQRIKRDLLMNADQQRKLEPYAIANTAMMVNLSKEISNELLKYHWCWIHPLFLFIYRPAFIRGMSLLNMSSPGAPDPPYFSETLLKVIHAHCARFLNHDVYNEYFQQSPGVKSPGALRQTAKEFMQKMTEEARVSLGLETMRASSIPTIQALLQQSAREVVFGRSSQAWLYGGMAFRMAFDMGIHLPSDKLQTFVKSLSAEDIEIRKRLFWSCYTWDKILSLYLGRMPGFTPDIEDVPLTFMDDYSDTDMWAPYYGDNPTPDFPHAPNYPPVPGYVVSTFRELCKLCIILNDLLQSIYSSESTARRNLDDQEHLAAVKAANEAPFIRISQALRDWWTELSPHLRASPEQLPPLAPPVHIMSINLLYHTTLILLHRPIILGTRDLNSPALQRSFQTCLNATAAIHDLLVLQADTFGLSHVSYLNAYSAYIAATVAVLRFERDHVPGEDPVSSSQKCGLDFLLHVLERTATAMPALERSLVIIRKRMKSVIDRNSRSNQHTPYPDIMNPSDPHATYSAIATSQPFELPPQTSAYSASMIANGYHAPDPAAYAPSSLPAQWQSDLRSSLYTQPPIATFDNDFLPAFPGQQFAVGSEHSFGSNEGINSEARTALLGYNLDPHPRLNPESIDWGFMEGFEAATGQFT